MASARGSWCFPGYLLRRDCGAGFILAGVVRFPSPGDWCSSGAGGARFLPYIPWYGVAVWFAAGLRGVLFRLLECQGSPSCTDEGDRGLASSLCGTSFVAAAWVREGVVSI